jgi:hypothetical protein
MSDLRESQGSGRFRATPMSQADTAAQAVMMQLYSLLHPIFTLTFQPQLLPNLAERFCQMLRTQFQVAGVAEFDLHVAGQRLSLNRRPVRLEGAEHARALTVGQWLLELGIVRLKVRNALDAESVQQFVLWLERLHRGQAGAAEAVEIGAFSVGMAPHDPEFEALLTDLQQCSRLPLLLLYADSLSQLVELENGTQGREFEDPIIPLKRVAAQVIDALRADAAGILGLTALRPVPGHPEVLRLDTMVLTVALAMALGIADDEVLEVGTAVLAAPIFRTGSGWTEAPVSPGNASRAAVSNHPLCRVLTFETLQGQGRVVPALAYGDPTEKHPIALIVDVARSYVDLVHGRPGLPAHLPSAAIQRMIAHSGSRFDDDVIGALVSILGLYPPGSVVRLNSGDLAVVIDSPPVGDDIRRPSVRLLSGIQRQVFPLHDPALEAYRVVDADVPSELGPNPFFCLLY